MNSDIGHRTFINALYPVHPQVWVKSERNQIRIANYAMNVNSFKGGTIPFIPNGDVKK